MLNHFLKIFFRTTFKNPSYSFINVAGLAVGFACSIFILLWIIDETTFDKFHADKERVFQIMGNHAFPDGTQTLEQTPGPLAEGLIELPEVEESCRIRFGGGRILFNHGTQSIYENGVFADISIFSVFTIPLDEGNTTNPLPDINSIAISKKLASKYFKNESALGRVFRLDSKTEAKVTAVFNDLPSSSTLQFDFIIPYPVYSQVDQYNKEWGAWSGGKTYVKLKEGSNVAFLNKKIGEVLTKPKIWPRWDSNVELFLFPITDWRLYNNFNNGIQDGGRITYVRIFSIVAGFILLIACIGTITGGDQLTAKVYYKSTDFDGRFNSNITAGVLSSKTGSKATFETAANQFTFIKTTKTINGQDFNLLDSVFISINQKKMYEIEF